MVIQKTFKTARPQISYTSDSGLEAFYNYESNEWELIFEVYDEDDRKLIEDEIQDFIEEIKEEFGNYKG